MKAIEKKWLRYGALALLLLLFLLIVGGGELSGPTLNKRVAVHFQNNGSAPQIYTVNGISTRVLPGSVASADIPLKIQRPGDTDSWSLVVTDDSGKQLASSTRTWNYDEAVSHDSVNVDPLSPLEAVVAALTNPKETRSRKGAPEPSDSGSGSSAPPSGKTTGGSGGSPNQAVPGKPITK